MSNANNDVSSCNCCKNSSTGGVETKQPRIVRVTTNECIAASLAEISKTLKSLLDAMNIYIALTEQLLETER